MASMGAIEDEAEAERGAEDDDEGGEGEGEDERFGVWPENERALQVFLAVRRLWRIGPLGGVLGLDRPSVESELRMRKVKVDATLLDDLAAIEGGALEVWNAKE